MDIIERLHALLPNRILSLLCGKLLGDANLTNEEGKKPRLRFQHSIKDRDWCEFNYSCLKDFLPLSSPKYKFTKDPRLKAGFSESYYVQSRTTEITVLLKALWYKGRKKIIPYDFVRLFLNAEALAWWYQDDGSLRIDNNTPRKIILSTDNFTIQENKTLIQVLFEKFSLTFSLDGQNRLCLYDKHQILLFLHIIEPYVHFSMSRKKLQKSITLLTQIPMSKRTTLYLPSALQLQKPTKEIQQVIDQIDEKEFIHFILTSINNIQQLTTKSYQIVLYKRHFEKLATIKSLTGLTNSKIVQLAFSKLNSTHIFKI